jgi:hypothetical protein
MDGGTSYKFLDISGFIDFLMVWLAWRLLLFAEDQLVPQFKPTEQSPVRSVVGQQLKK